MHHLDLILTLTGGLTAALIFGYLSQRIGLSPIVGYLIAGIVVSSNTPGFVADAGLAKQMAEFGVILLMFGVGLHFHFHELLAVKRIAIPGALVQSGMATVVSMLAMRAFGWSWTEGLVFGLAIAVASTVVLTRILVDKNHLHTPTGHIAIGWLVVEDLLTVFVLVLIPAIFGDTGGSVGAMQITWAVALTSLKIVALVAFIFVVGGWLIPRILTNIARTHSRELFTLSILVIALGIAVGAAKVFGVSMELGAFLAGMVVARSDFSTRAATDALPMKDAFAVLFFVSVGMLFDWKAAMETPWLVACTVAIVMLIKPLAALVISTLLGYPLATGLAVAAVLAQIGEFSFIVGTMGKMYGLVSDDAFNALVATAIVSITLAPLCYRTVPWLDRRIGATALGRWLKTRQSRQPSHHYDELPGTHRRRAVIVGSGPVGKTVLRLLQDNEFLPAVIEMNVDTVKSLKENGIPAFFGDASHPETLKAAGVPESDILILSSSSIPMGREIIQEAKRMNPSIRVIARTAYLREADELLAAGATAVFSGEGEVALSITEKILEAFGATREQVERERERIRSDFFSDGSRQIVI